MNRTQLAQGLLGAFALLCWGCGPEPDAVCYDDEDEIMPDEEIRGTRLGDVLEPYFGQYQGTLSWATGSNTGFILRLPYEPGTPYRLSNVWQCDARNVSYSSHAHVTTDDAAFDDEVFVSVYSNLPDAAEGAIPDSVLSFSGMTEPEWQAGLAGKLGVSLERYSSSSVHFELDWPPGAPSPIGGILRWRGTLVLDAKTQDTVQVATLTF